MKIALNILITERACVPVTFAQLSIRCVWSVMRTCSSITQSVVTLNSIKECLHFFSCVLFCEITVGHVKRQEYVWKCQQNEQALAMICKLWLAPDEGNALEWNVWHCHKHLTELHFFLWPPVPALLPLPASSPSFLFQFSPPRLLSSQWSTSTYISLSLHLSLFLNLILRKYSINKLFSANPCLKGLYRFWAFVQFGSA